MHEETNIYELGFHVVPTLAEEALSTEWSELKSLIESKGGSFIGEGFPKPYDLAYEIAQEEKGAYRKFTRSYFGWLKFNLNTDKVVELESEVKSRHNVLRYILVKTVADNTLYGDPEKKDKKEDHVVTPEAALSSEAAPAQAPADESAAA